MKKRIMLFSALALIVFAFSVFAQPTLYITSYCDASLEACKVQDAAVAVLEKNNPYDIKADYMYYFDTANPQSSLAQIAVECANKQGMKEEYKTVLQNNFDVLSMTALKQYAEYANLNSVNFTFCLDTQMTAWDVLEQVQEAEEDGVTTAPSVRFNADIYEGSQTLTSLKELAEDYLNKPIDTEISEESAEIELPVEEEAVTPLIEEVFEEQPAEQGQEELEQIEDPLFFRVIRQIRSWMLNVFQ